jgi:NAD-dependent DNA ligase
MGDKNKILDKLNSLLKLMEHYNSKEAKEDKAYIGTLIESFSFRKGREKLSYEEMLELNSIFGKYKDGNTIIDKKTGLAKKKFVTNQGVKDSLRDVAVVFTGFRDKEFEREITKNGGAVYGSISGNVTHLICKDVKANTVKMKKARALGIKILDTKTFEEFVTLK